MINWKKNFYIKDYLLSYLKNYHKTEAASLKSVICHVETFLGFPLFKCYYNPYIKFLTNNNTTSCKSTLCILRKTWPKGFTLHNALLFSSFLVAVNNKATSVIIKDSIFVNSRIEVDGGKTADVLIKNCSLKNSHSFSKSTLLSLKSAKYLLMTSCTISNNSAYIIINAGNTNATMENCTIDGNKATYAILSMKKEFSLYRKKQEDKTRRLHLTNCTFIRNTAKHLIESYDTNIIVNRTTIEKTAAFKLLVITTNAKVELSNFDIVGNQFDSILEQLSTNVATKNPHQGLVGFQGQIIDNAASSLLELTSTRLSVSQSLVKNNTIKGSMISSLDTSVNIHSITVESNVAKNFIDISRRRGKENLWSTCCKAAQIIFNIQYPIWLKGCWD